MRSSSSGPGAAPGWRPPWLTSTGCSSSRWRDSRLQTRAGTAQAFHEPLCGAIEPWRLRGIQLDVAIVDAQAGKCRQHMFHESYLRGRAGQASCAAEFPSHRRPARTPSRADGGRCGRIRFPVEGGAGANRIRIVAPRQEPHADQVGRAHEGPLIAIADPSHGIASSLKKSGLDCPLVPLPKLPKSRARSKRLRPDHLLRARLRETLGPRPLSGICLATTRGLYLR